MSIHLQKKFCVKIPDDVTALYFDRFRTLILKTKITQKLYQSNFKLFFSKSKKIVFITNLLALDRVLSSKRIKMSRGIELASIKQLLLENSNLLHTKLILIGVGYKVLLVKSEYYSTFQIKLGFSHNLYFLVDKNVKVSNLKATSLLLFSNNYMLLNSFSSKLKKARKFDFYKGKGIVTINQKITLKKSKNLK